jgi:enamine deaminase RidA (YjgF/YER057c/UK114 family)
MQGPGDRRLISSGSPFERTYGYSRAVVSGDEVHIAGTTGYDYATMAMPDDPAEQTRNIFATFAAVLRERWRESRRYRATARFRDRRLLLRAGA